MQTIKSGICLPWPAGTKKEFRGYGSSHQRGAGNMAYPISALMGLLMKRISSWTGKYWPTWPWIIRTHSRQWWDAARALKDPRELSPHGFLSPPSVRYVSSQFLLFPLFGRRNHPWCTLCPWKEADRRGYIFRQGKDGRPKTDLQFYSEVPISWSDRSLFCLKYWSRADRPTSVRSGITSPLRPTTHPWCFIGKTECWKGLLFSDWSWRFQVNPASSV